MKNLMAPIACAKKQPMQGAVLLVITQAQALIQAGIAYGENALQTKKNAEHASLEGDTKKIAAGLHQAACALDWIGLDGVAPLPELMQSAIMAVSDNNTDQVAELLSSVAQTGRTLHWYLNAIALGYQIASIRLFSCYRRLYRLLSKEDVHPSVLLSIAVENPDTIVYAFPDQVQSLSAVIQADDLRMQFEQALLNFLRASEAEGRTISAEKIAAIICAIAQQKMPALQHVYWYLLWAFAECVQAGLIADLGITKKIFAAVGSQVRHLADARPPSLPRQLLKDTLFAIGRIKTPIAAADHIANLFHLHFQLPADFQQDDESLPENQVDSAVMANFCGLLKKIRATIDEKQAEESLQSALSPWFEQLSVAALDHFSSLSTGLHQLGTKLGEQGITQQGMLMLAGWILLMESGLGNELTAAAWLENERNMLADVLDDIIQGSQSIRAQRALSRAAIVLDQDATGRAIAAAAWQSLSVAERKIEESVQSEQFAAVATAVDQTLIMLAGVSAFIGEQSLKSDADALRTLLKELVQEADTDPARYHAFTLSFVMLMQQAEKMRLHETAIFDQALPEKPEQALPEPVELTYTPGPVLHLIYASESRQLVTQLHELIDQWLTEPHQRLPLAAVHAAHSLAGSSATVGLHAVQEIAAMLEQVLQIIADTPANLPALQYEILQDAVRLISQMLLGLESGDMPAPQPDAVQALALLRQQLEYPDTPEPTQAGQSDMLVFAEMAMEKIAPSGMVDPELRELFMLEAEDLLPRLSQQLRALQDGQDKAAPATELLRILHTLKGSARMAGAGALGDQLHEMENAVDQFAHHEGTEPRAIEKLFAQLDQAMHLFSVLDAENPPPGQEQMPAKVRPVIDSQLSPVVQLRVRSDLLERLSSSAAELAVGGARVMNEFQSQRQAIADLADNINRLRGQLRELEIQAETRIASQLQINSSEEFDPLEFDRYTSLQELTRMMAESLGDIVSVQRTLARHVDDAGLAISAQTRHARNLQTDMRRVRIVQFASIAERLHHLVRQTGRELDKEVRLEIQGGHVEIDRSMLEKIGAPLEHLLRNAIVHGIESAAERVQAGKPADGTIRIHLAQQGNEIVILVGDDGRGLDLDRIREKAISAGLLQAGSMYTEDELAALIFEPGLSTAEQLTAVAGRGIGMDVVRATVLAQGGALDVSTRTGAGVDFRIVLPLIQATAQVVLVNVGDRMIALPSTMVEQVLQLPAAQAAAARQAKAVTWRGKTVPLHHLGRLLGETPAAAYLGVSAPPVQIAILRGLNDLFAIEMDAIHGNREVVVKNIGPQLASVPGISGATILADGSVVLILNPLPLIESAMREQRSIPANSLQLVLNRHAATLPLILVVDDSLTVRRVSQRLLERCGYAVALARDGMEAFEKLQTLSPSVVLLDIEMPRMDGFELLRKIRQEADTQKLPVVMITSRSADRHREHAFQLGATAYLGKPFNESELLSLLKQLCDKEKFLHAEAAASR